VGRGGVIFWAGVVLFAFGGTLIAWGIVARHASEGKAYNAALTIGAVFVSVGLALSGMFFRVPAVVVDATASPSPVPTVTQKPLDTETALSVLLVNANILGTPGPDGTVPVRVLYKITANVSIQAAYGQAGIPFADSCDGGVVNIEEHGLPSGATVERSETVFCSQADANRLAGDTKNFYSMDWRPATVVSM
jgi:hypothetical protein